VVDVDVLFLLIVFLEVHVIFTTERRFTGQQDVQDHTHTPNIAFRSIAFSCCFVGTYDFGGHVLWNPHVQTDRLQHGQKQKKEKKKRSEHT